VKQRSDRTSVFAQYTIFVENRGAVQEKLKDAGIPTAIHYPLPLNEQPAYAEFCHLDTPVAANVSGRVLSLPMGADISKQNQDVIVSHLCEK
jgi:UDP-2-acetamido-2-deoxy-ribo-hexuluronate aminotransferase